MKAVVSSELGKTPQVGTFAAPQAQGDEVIVEVLAAGIKQLDRAIVAGTRYSSPKHLPFVPGTDGVGLTADGRRVAVLRRTYLQIIGSGSGNFPPVPQLQETVASILSLAQQGVIGIDTQEHAIDEVATAWDVNKKSDVRSVIRIRG